MAENPKLPPPPDFPDTPDSANFFGRPSYLPAELQEERIPPTIRRETEFWTTGRGLVLNMESADALLEAQELMSDVYMSGVLEEMGLNPKAKGQESNKGHSVRDAVISLLINQELPPQAKVRSRILAIGAIFHDIGKLDEKINPIVMSNERYPKDHPNRRIIELHPIIGAEVAIRMPGIEIIEERALIARIIRQHHELMDGSGYPDKLTGPAICKEARVLTVADVADAMGEERPYKQILPPQSIMRAIKADTEKGKYDREVCFAFQKLYGKSGMIVRHRISNRPERLA